MAAESNNYLSVGQRCSIWEVYFKHTEQLCTRWVNDWEQDVVCTVGLRYTKWTEQSLQACYSEITLLGRVALDRVEAGYSHQTFPWTICRSVGRCVGLSSALWKNGGSHPDAFWHHRSDGSMDEAGSGVCQSVHGKVLLVGGEFGARHCNQWGLTLTATRPSSQIILGRLVIGSWSNWT